MKVLVVNSGSSSLKAQLMETDGGKVLAKAGVERIGLEGSFMTYTKGEKTVIKQKMPTHKEAFQLFFKTLTDEKIGAIQGLDEIKAIGHRMVNFGEKFTSSIVVTKTVLKELEKNIHFAPLHNPPALLGVQVCMELMPKVKNVAVFDTSFHSTMEDKVFTYAIPYEFYTKNKIRRYGAHGTSHRYIAMKCKELFGNLKGKKIISCHLGNGSSICAIKDGKCVDTSMGYTPLAGVIMGTRSGDIDPAIVKQIAEIKKCSVDEAINILNKQSGLLGVTGKFSDLRDIGENLNEPRVKLAFDMLVYSIKKYIGAYTAAMNGVDCIVFTAGIGENDEKVREAVCSDLEYLGVVLDKKVNSTLPRGSVEKISSKKSKVKIYRIPTDEEYMIALDTAELTK